MELVVGLGNPGEKYEKQRHNVGFLLIDKVASHEGLSWEVNKKLDALVCKIKNTVFLKPQTFMNNSGDAVSRALNFYKIDPEKMVVLHDDLDLEFGRVKISFDSESAGHHGIEDIILKTGTKKFYRCRFGIGRPLNKELVSSYVLEPFSKAELETINKLDVFSLLPQDLDK